jgi:hypothetical protein
VCAAGASLIFHFPGESDFDPPASNDHAIERQQNDGASYRGQKAGWFTWRVPPHGTSNRVSDKSASHPQQRCNDEAAWITSGHQEFCDDPNYETDK